MSSRILLSLSFCASLQHCSTESVDLTGRWEGIASVVVDGEQKETPLALELNQTNAGIAGTLLWGEYLRTITAASAKGPEIELESATATDRLRMKALFRNDSLEGRFWIQYSSDPEPFPGSFHVARKR